MLSPMTHSKTLSLFKFKAFSLLLAFFLSFYLIGCGGGSSSSGSDTVPTGNTEEYTISFFDENLDIIGSVTKTIGNYNITDIADELGIPSSVYAANSSIAIAGDITYSLTENVYFYLDKNVQEIADQGDLNAVRDNLSGKYILTADINLIEGGAGFDDVKGWEPIGAFIRQFSGIFNGNNHTITNLWINRPSDNYVGLFGVVENAQIKNLGVEIAEGKEVNGGDCIGGIAGASVSSTITNSYSTGNINGNYYYVGGIVGYIYGGSITNSYSTGNVNGNSENVGGIAGYIDNGIITNSYSTGNVNGSYYVGGITGYVSGGNITNSYSTGNING
ncbi:MAG: hypothetical protein LBH45_03490, partial [Campylobacteraceae bacterium]|nr:hypothetical protein [Campylobacteraceae bacterium]